MKPNWIDAHLHLTHCGSDEDIDTVLAHAQSLGGVFFMQGGTDPEDWMKQERIRSRHPQKIGTSFGLHPWWVDVQTTQSIDTAFEILKKHLLRAHALGELGLDFGKRTNRANDPKQIEAFKRQLLLGIQVDKPLVLHVVKAHDQALKILSESSLSSYRGIVHSYSHSLNIAKKYTDLGLLISVGPGILKEGFESLKKMIRSVDLRFITLETDAPDQLENPADVIQVAQAISEIRGGNPSAEEVLKIAAENFRRQFQIETL